MLLLTGATGLAGSALLRRLTDSGAPVRCLVRDPRRLGPDRVRVQIALGDLADPPSFRNALRGVQTVVHLAAVIRDQPGGSIEELNATATTHMLQAAARAGVEHFVFFGSLGATNHHHARVLRAKALAEHAVLASGVPHTVLAPSLVYAPGDRLLTLIERLAMVLPMMPISGRGAALLQPIWAEDVADCVMRVLRDGPTQPHRHELCGPQTLTHRQIVALVLRAAGRDRRLVSIPPRLVARALSAGELLLGSRAPLTRDEAELLEVSMTGSRGVADVTALGVAPRAMGTVLGLASQEDEGPGPWPEPFARQNCPKSP